VVQAGANAAAAAPAGNGPTVTGKILNLKPDETPMERALELTEKLAVAEEHRRGLAVRIQQLEATLCEKDKALQQAEQEVLLAADEMNRARNELLRWKEQVIALRDKLGSTEKENLETLQSVVGVIEKLLEQEKRPEEKRETPPPPAPNPE
jgi:hypothetical protein